MNFFLSYLWPTVCLVCGELCEFAQHGPEPGMTRSESEVDMNLVDSGSTLLFVHQVQGGAGESASGASHSWE